MNSTKKLRTLALAVAPTAEFGVEFCQQVMSLGLVDRGGKLSQLLALGLRELDKHFKVAPRA